jgi:hypothetical protein
VARRERIDMVDRRFGRLVGVAFHEILHNHAWWLFQCDCGETTVADGAKVRGGNTRSCGCLHREISAARLTTHGWRAKKRHDSTYRAWQEINSLCTNPAVPRFRDFGALGIAVAPAWADDFEAFVAVMGERPANTILERIDRSGDFAPGNCRWASARSRAVRAKESHPANRLPPPPIEWLRRA